MLAINPGSTSTRVGLFWEEAAAEGQAEKGRRGEEAVLEDPRLMAETPLWEQLSPRLEAIRGWLEEAGVGVEALGAVVARGGLLRPVEGGIYAVSPQMIEDARQGVGGEHPANLGCALAASIGERARARGKPVPALVVDPVSTDEFLDLARISGLRGIERKSLSHALSIHAVARQAAARLGVPFPESRFVVAHLGGGISVCPVAGGRILDANNANSGGPFSPTRAGGLPTQELLDLAFSGRFDREGLRDLTTRRGGLVSYLGTSDARAVEERIDAGDREAAQIYEAMAYQIAKEIGAMATVLHGRLDAVVLTGGLSKSSRLVAWIRERTGHLGRIEVWGETQEMHALADAGFRFLKGVERAKEYPGEGVGE